MCGRYEIRHLDQLKARFGVADQPSFLTPNPDVTPGLLMPVVLQTDSERQLELMKWGLVPSWAKDPKIGNKTINARAETVAEKPSYRKSFQSKRCLVPASGFYEWQATPGGKIRYHFAVKGEELFAFAGLYDIWRDPEGHELATYTIITTQANELVAPVHDRMPVILPHDAEALWLDPASSLPDLSALLRPFDPSRMEGAPAAGRFGLVS